MRYVAISCVMYVVTFDVTRIYLATLYLNANGVSRAHAHAAVDLDALLVTRVVIRCHLNTSSRRQVQYMYIRGYLSHLQLVALLLARGISAIPRGTHAACVHTYLRLR